MISLHSRAARFGRIPFLPGSLMLLFALGTAALPATAAHAQDTTVAIPLEQFVEEVAKHWSTGDVMALVDLIPADNRLTLDTGSGIETANTRHAAAALRALFTEAETMDAEPVRVTVSSSQPVRGFGELSWRYRTRGMPGQQSRSVYVGARWEGEGWVITELRLIP